MISRYEEVQPGEWVVEHAVEQQGKEQCDVEDEPKDRESWYPGSQGQKSACEPEWRGEASQDGDEVVRRHHVLPSLW